MRFIDRSGGGHLQTLKVPQWKKPLYSIDYFIQKPQPYFIQICTEP